MTLLYIVLATLVGGLLSVVVAASLTLSVLGRVVRSLVSENMALGDQARRWLDDDEYLVRRRVHGDMRRLLASHGL